MIKNQITIGMNGSMLDEKPTGVGVYSYSLINNLSNLITNSKWKKMIVFTPTSTLLNKNIKTIKLPGLLQSSKHGKLAAFCRFTWNTISYPMQARKFDVLISPTTHGSFLLNNQIITIHDLLSLRYKNISTHQRFYFKYLLPTLINKAKLIIAVSENTKRDIIHFLNALKIKLRLFTMAMMTKVIFRWKKINTLFTMNMVSGNIYWQWGRPIHIRILNCCLMHTMHLIETAKKNIRLL